MVEVEVILVSTGCEKFASELFSVWFNGIPDATGQTHSHEDEFAVVVNANEDVDVRWEADVVTEVVFEVVSKLVDACVTWYVVVEVGDIGEL